MTFDVEIMLRHDERVFSERLSCPGEPARWTEADAGGVLRQILQAIDRVLNPGESETREVSLRGLSWIVSPYQQGVVIALEIHSASAVAGPFDVDQAELTRLVSRAVASRESDVRVH
jgi:hypothetical protein